MDLSAVIVSFNSRDDLGPCLASILEHTAGIEYEVIVVDNASRDGSPDLVAAEFPQVRLIRRPDNGGLARATNEGIRASFGELIAWMNPDLRLAGNVLEAMVRYLRQHPDIGALGPKLLDPDGSLQLSCRRFPGFRTAVFNRYSLATRLFPKNPFSAHYLMADFDHQAIADVDWLSGAFLVLRRQALEQVGLLDEGYFMYSEDVDLCQRLHRAGWRVVYFPEVAVTHHIGRSTEQAPNRMLVERHRSMWRYYRRWMRRGLLTDALALAGIIGRCCYLLATNNLGRALRRLRQPRRTLSPAGR